ncbi:MAG: lycopene cyclase family protein [Chitinophagaceae bacterium]
MLKSGKYDFIFLGAGCASLSLLLRLLHSGQTRDKKILLIDKEPKTKNDRTWCFWEKEPGFFEEIVFKKWDSISVLGDGPSSPMDIHPYRYKMIRGIDFYNYCFREIAKHDNIEIVYGDLQDFQYEKPGSILLKINNQEFRLVDDSGVYVFNSIYRLGEPGKNIRLLQHFKGWLIETPQPAFEPEIARIMDFRVSQQYGTSFAYVLPFSATSALVEYTLFTKELLQPAQYDTELKAYIKDLLGISEYKIREQEFGVIPMTNEQFNSLGWGIGTAGGQTKASSGFTFQFIQKQSEQIARFLLEGKNLNKLPATPKRFRFYDNTLLYILYHNKVPGKKIFTDLFKKNKPQQVLRFLDNESSLKEELKIIATLPTWPFLKAAIKQL